jgi:hypothetical protein
MEFFDCVIRKFQEDMELIKYSRTFPTDYSTPTLLTSGPIPTSATSAIADIAHS